MPLEQFSETESFTLKGNWWRPGGPNRLTGELDYAPDRIELNLDGAFDDAVGDSPFSWQPKVPELPIVHGITVKGTPVSLLDSFYTHWQPGGTMLDQAPVPITSSTVLANRLLLGVHLDTPDEACFTKCRVALPNLEFWLGDTPFVTESSADPAGMTVKYVQPSDHIIALSDGGELRIRYSFLPPGFPSNEYVIKHRAQIEVSPTGTCTLDWFVQIIGRVENLFTLLFGHPVQTTRNELSATGSRCDMSGTALFYGMRRRLDQSRRKPHEFFLRYPDIAQWFPQIVDCWLNASDTIGHALVLLFSAIREPAAFLETRFLPIVQAAEVYARAETPGTLAHANELRLKQKMHALLDTLEPNTLTLFCKQRDEFVRGIVDTRNYYTHYSDRYDRVLQSMELHWATVKLQLMLKILLLKRLGVPESVLQAIIRKDHRLAAQRKEWSAITERGSPVRPSCSDPESAG